MRVLPWALLISSVIGALLPGCGARSELFGAGGARACAPEICDGLDNDCNGLVDEGCSCSPGDVQGCYSGDPATLNVGICQRGKQTCGPDGMFGPCAGEVLPGHEACNGLDDDCNGLVDDGFGVLSCGVGACMNTVSACQDGVPGTCQPLPPSPEICGDGIDNDCNGMIDDGCITGCSDGTREGFTDVMKFPGIAACSGGFSVPGLLALAPACGHQAGNSSANPDGTGCSAADLCAPGFHVCTGADEVAARSPTGCDGAADVPGLFFATGLSSTGCMACAVGTNTDPTVCDGCSCTAGCAQTSVTANDLFGCGTLGDPVSGCGVLDRFSNNLCVALGSPWLCGSDTDGCNEANVVTKASSDGGGVLCCSD